MSTLLIVLCIVAHCAAQDFRFSTFYHDHMVIQKGEGKQHVWGKSTQIGDTVRLTLTTTAGFSEDVGVATVGADGDWMININYTINHNYGPYTLTATSGLGSTSISDVLFGDVWVCSGQSNMEFNVHALENVTDELDDVDNFQQIRLFKAAHAQSNTTLDEFQTISTKWSRPSKGVVNGYSAVCWLYGKYLSMHISYPIGLVETNWGNTPIETWLSPDAVDLCSSIPIKRKVYPVQESVLWNAMVHPLLRIPIYGLIWYQGEANIGNADKYSCQFPTMINDWRKKFHEGSANGTSLQFPIGFVQLAPWRSGEVDYGFPEIRWSQTANQGMVPNVEMPDTFMAVAMDLPDFASPRGSIHPRYKHDIAARLVLGAMGVAYHQTGVDYQGPFPSSFTQGQNSLMIEYSQGRVPLDVRSDHGFEICCTNTSDPCTKTSANWVQSPILSHDTSSVTVDTSDCEGVGIIQALRYAWRETPCDFKQCAIYGRDNDLPGPPFYQSL